MLELDDLDLDTDLASSVTVVEWGEALGTISYEIVTGISARVARSYRD